MHLDWTALGQVFLVSFALGAGTVALFSAGLAATSRGNRVVPAACFLVCAAVAGYGIYLVAVH
ncbi:hypothetical protein ABZ816_22370 [Actinosynnema sp. NPDC047251]|uniref:Putative secreted protein n=1 Tax=Saccharothrix espanaensis (strain ATCC 51144 / DSM 44229 / JCM 9112 / NBRC 15066 / NRRL 15764) TaxID=1179773 RepID=K0KAM1_SACES|nr:hypothetical protein [Saccharothrix espanaensis]CCH33653.1 putative secreted protein [Saccharothrix espanaensis DSM 44229]